MNSLILKFQKTNLTLQFNHGSAFRGIDATTVIMLIVSQLNNDLIFCEFPSEYSTLDMSYSCRITFRYGCLRVQLNTASNFSLSVRVPSFLKLMESLSLLLYHIITFQGDVYCTDCRQNAIDFHDSYKRLAHARSDIFDGRELRLDTTDILALF